MTVSDSCQPQMGLHEVGSWRLRANEGWW